MSRIRIEVLSGDDAGKVFESDADVVRIGRGPECELRLSGAQLSSRHARISAKDGGFAVEDEGSANGSALLHGESRLELELNDGQHALAHGDELELGADSGEPTRLRVLLGREPPPPDVVATRSLQELSSASQALEPKLWSAVLGAL